ncbi:putative ferric reductase transmembrane component [Spathaspora sp. JA1]|nr:putative ferric reductase transmembrane component [Spathaspora sp. JA1]
MNLFYPFYLFYLLNVVHAFEWTYKTVALYSCVYQVDAKFCPLDKDCLCSNKDSLATIAGCITYKNRATPYLIDYTVDYCATKYKTEIDPNWYDVGLPHFNKNAVNESDIHQSSDEPYTVPVRFSEEDMDFFIEASNRFQLNYDNSIWYGVSVYGFWLIVLLISAFSHWTMVFFPKTTKKWISPMANFYRKHISNPALYGKFKSESVSGWVVLDSLVPTRFESIVIVVFYIFIFLENVINVTAVRNDPVFGSVYLAELRYSGVRTGLIGTIMLPLVFLFGGRNNFLQWICGLNYSTFLCYHRHLARVMFVLVAIHSVNYTILEVRKEAFNDDLKEPWFYWGIIATLFGGIVLMQSILYLRRNWYEMFRIVHILLAVFFVVGTWVHIAEFEYAILLYPTVAVWCFDWFVRICRLIYFGFPKVNVCLVGHETIRMVIPKPKIWTATPGGHVFIYFMIPKYFWQSHPFTFTNSNKGDIVMYLKVKEGITLDLYKSLNRCQGKMITMRVGIEGPYGESTPAKYSDTAVFIAGGSGIPGLYAEIYDISLRKPGQSSLKLYWVIREYESLIWFYDELLKLKNTNIETTIYITKPNIKISRVLELDESKEGFKELTNLNSCESDDTIEQLRTELSHVQFEEGRPDIEQLIQDEIRHSPGSISFVTCGHPTMVDEVRYYSCKNIDNKYRKRVDFYEQLQVWA